jgi:transcriptional regulator with XRE-family HTH domain
MSDQPAPIPRVIGDNLRRARALRGWTVRDMAARMSEIGAPMLISTISQSERAERKVSVEDLARFAAALNVAPVDLLTPEVGSLDIAPGVLPIPNHTVGSWVSGTDPWPPDADRKAFLELADEYRRTVDATWNRPEMLAISVLEGIVRETITETITGETKYPTDPAKRAALLRREARRVRKYVDALAESIGDDDGR